MVVFFGGTQVIGMIIMMLISGLSSLAGLGGGGPNVVVLISCFGVLPKDATIIVFACVFGSAFGNMLNQTRRAIDGQPVINYTYISITIPIMFIGTLLGVFINQLLPSLATVSIIVVTAIISLPRIYHRFRIAYQYQSQQNQIHRISQLLHQTTINPFQDPLTIKVAKQIILLVIGFLILSIIRGSKKFSSIAGIQNCSFLFWMIEASMFAFAVFFYKKNMHFVRVWTAPGLTLGEQLFQKDDIVEKHEDAIIKGAVGAGVFSGLGLGGGIFLVPLFRLLNLTPFQATSTAAFIVFIASGMNVIQALLLGVLTVKDFLFFFIVTCTGSYCISKVVNSWLRRMNRFSFVELLLFILIGLSSGYLPYSLWDKVHSSEGNWSLILSFGSLC